MTDSYDLPLLPVGTRVRITAPGVWGENYEGEITRAYRIRYGHRVYDISDHGHTYTYYAHEQLTVLEAAK